MNADTNSWHNQEERLGAKDQVNPDLNKEYLYPENDRIEETLQKIDSKQLSDLEKRMSAKLQEEDTDDKNMWYIAAFREALKILQGAKSGRSLENMIDNASRDERTLDAVLSIGDFSEDRFPFLPQDENIKHAVTFLRRQIGFHSYHNHRNKYDIVSRIREQREDEEIQKIKDNLNK